MPLRDCRPVHSRQQFWLCPIVYFGGSLPILPSLPSVSVDLIYIDPPFNTSKAQERSQGSLYFHIDYCQLASD